MDHLGNDGHDFVLDEAAGLPMPTLMGDFYRETDNVTRGLTLPVDGFDVPSDLRFGGFGFEYSSPACMDSFGGFGVPIPQQASSWDGQQQFVDGFLAPLAPADPFFTFATTTLVVHCDRPSALMNSLLTFLATQVVSSISKVSERKLSLKADVFIHNVMCSLKARSYQQEPGVIALEIQKRSGDSLTFAGVYNAASRYLQANNFVIIRGMPEDSGGYLAPPPLARGRVDLQDYSPLLDMARQSSMPDLQVEAAREFASLTMDPEVADALCSEPGPLKDMTMLLAPERLDIAVPAATLFFNLAQCPRAAACFDEGLVRKLQEKVQLLSPSPSTSDASSLARQQLEQALAATQSWRQ
jgi:hypothetical protein